jgi:hypothetical protein
MLKGLAALQDRVGNEVPHDPTECEIEEIRAKRHVDKAAVEVADEEDKHRRGEADPKRTKYGAAVTESDGNHRQIKNVGKIL